MSSPEQTPTGSEAEERQRGAFEYVREAWATALASVTAGEEEVQKMLKIVASWIEVGPEEARKLGVELNERLRRERHQFDETLQSAVKGALTPFRLPSREDVQALATRLDRLEDRVEKISRR